MRARPWAAQPAESSARPTCSTVARLHALLTCERYAQSIGGSAREQRSFCVETIVRARIETFVRLPPTRETIVRARIETFVAAASGWRMSYARHQHSASRDPSKGPKQDDKNRHHAHYTICESVSFDSNVPRMGIFHLSQSFHIFYPWLCTILPCLPHFTCHVCPSSADPAVSRSTNEGQVLFRVLPEV